MGERKTAGKVLKGNFKGNI